MKYKTILLTGGTGKLGQRILASGYFNKLLAPERAVMDITDGESIRKFFKEHEFDAVIHCAALARMALCENNPEEALKVNAIGTSNLVNGVLRKEKDSKKSIRFIHISTDGVYSGTEGNYSEKDATIPYNRYGWTKLAAESSVRLLSNFCIIRTSFFDSENIKFDTAAIDAYSSKLPIMELVKAISFMVEHDFTGVINVGSDRLSDYERYKEYKADIKPGKFSDIAKQAGLPLAQDASMNCNLWKNLQKDFTK